MKVIFLCFFLLCSCGKIGDGKLHISNQVEDGIGLPEPTVGNRTPRFKLTQLAAVHEKFFTLNDSIVFTGLKEKMREKKSLRNVNLNIKSHCLLNKETVIIKQFSRKLDQSIPLIELLPEKVLLYQGNNYPSCGFSFKAENKVGSAHHFELPQLPIMDYKKSRFIQFFSASKRIDESFPYLIMDSISDYWLDIGTQKPIDNLNLVCSNFSLSLQIRPQQFVPVSVFPFNQLREKLKEEINKKKPVQTCRILGYMDKTLVGVSYVFYLHHSVPTLYVSIKDDLFKDKESSFYSEFMQLRSNGSVKEKKDRPNVALYSYSIRNSHPYPVYILIENYKKRKDKELLLDFYGLYYNSRKGGFYVLHDDSFYLDGIKTIRGQTFQKKVEDGTFIKLEPGSRIAFSVVLKKTFGLCKTKQKADEKIYWLGGIVKYPDLKIYQLVSDKIESISLAQNIWRQLDTKPGKGFSVLTDYLISEKAVSNFEHLWFRQGICGGKIVADTNDPLIELYKNGSRVKTRWIESTPVHYHQYKQTDSTIGFLINQLSQKKRKK